MPVVRWATIVMMMMVVVVAVGILRNVMWGVSSLYYFLPTTTIINHGC